MIRIRFFGPRALIQRTFRAAWYAAQETTVSPGSMSAGADGVDGRKGVADPFRASSLDPEISGQ